MKSQIVSDDRIDLNVSRESENLIPSNNWTMSERLGGKGAYMLQHLVIVIDVEVVGGVGEVEGDENIGGVGE